MPPISLDLREWSTSSPPRLTSGPLNSLLDEYSIPLPPSGPSSHCEEETEPVDHSEPMAQAEDNQEHQCPDTFAVNGVLPDDPLVDNRLESKDHLEQPSSGIPVLLGSRAHSPTSFTREVRLPMPLLDFLDLIARDTVEREHSMLLQRHVLTLLRQCGIDNRHLPIKRHLYRRMVDCFRTDRKASFASLYSQYLKLQISPSQGSEVPPMDINGGGYPVTHTQPEPASWFATMSLDARRGIVTFVQKLRDEPSYLADRLITLSSSQLQALVRPHRQATGPDTAPANHPGYGRFDPRNLRQRATRGSDQTPSSSPMLRDPMFVLLNELFDPLASWGSREKDRQLDVWSSACARVIQDGKPGSDDFCLVVADAFAEICPWTLKPQLELFLQDLMQSGQFMIDPPVKQSSPLVSTEIQNARMAVQTADFFDRSLVNLVELIAGDKLSRGVPRAVLDLIHATLRKIDDPDRRHKARSFFASRWYCTSFLSNIILFPERHHMMLGSHISTAIRQKIFRELAIRLQKALYRALSPRNSVSDLPSLIADEGTQRLLAAFDPPDSLVGSAESNSSTCIKYDRQYLMLRDTGILAVATALYPQESPEAIRARTFDRPISIASSFTGSTTLTAGTNEPRTGTSSSAAPSISGTSMTSNTLSSDLFFNNFDKPQGGTRTIENPFKSRPSTAGGFLPRIFDDPFCTFLLELTEQVRIHNDGQTSNTSGELLLYIRSSDGKLGTSLDELESKHDSSTFARSLELSNLDVPIPSHEVLRQALFRAALACKSFNHTDSTLFSLGPMSIDALFEKLMLTCRSSQDFKSAYFWSKSLAVSQSLGEEDKASIIFKAAEEYRRNIATHQSKSGSYHQWLLRLQELQKQQIDADQNLSLHCEALRDKMWFCTDVRHSSSYEETLNVIRALRNMAGPAPLKESGVTAWARQRLRTSFGHERAQTQVFEALSVPVERGGPNKLSDTQADLITSWLNQDSIENFCKGEERIHRFCFEIQKCARRLVGENLIDSPVLWSSSLYQAERDGLYAVNDPAPQHVQQQHLTWTTTYAFAENASNLKTYSSADPTIAGLGFSLPRQTFHSLPTTGGRSSTERAQDPGLFDSYTHTGIAGLPRDWTLPPSPVSPALNQDATNVTSSSRAKFVERLRQTLTALLISDFGLSLWSDGSETDVWLKDSKIPPALATAFDEFLPFKERTDILQTADRDLQEMDSGTVFSFSESYSTLLRRFQLSFDPFTKLESLLELTELASANAQSENFAANVDASSPLTDTTLTRGMNTLGSLGFGLPRTKLNRLEEVTANCEERRLMSIGALPTTNGTYNPAMFAHNSSAASGIDPATAVVRALFFDGRYRPSTLFRDLQMIAAFVPSSTLDHTASGTAFWDAGLAAMILKSDTCKLITNQANEILNHHLSNGNRREPVRTDSGESASQSKTGPVMSEADLSQTTLEDAAKLYTISALEGDPTAARELGLFYLTHPELVSRVTLPLSKPGEVFRSTSALGNGDKARDHDGILDPATFAVAFHWMEFAANAGDSDARTFLRENSDLEKAL